MSQNHLSEPTYLFPPGNALGLAPIYCVKVMDDSLSPLPRGCTVKVQRETWDELESGDMVVFPRESGRAYVRKLIIEKDQLLLVALNGAESEVVARSHLKLMERVLGIDF